MEHMELMEHMEQVHLEVFHGLTLINQTIVIHMPGVCPLLMNPPHS